MLFIPHNHFRLCNHHHIALILYSPLWWPFCCCVIMSLVMWFGCMPSCHWSSAPQNNDDDIWLFVRWGPLKPVNCAPQSLSILLLFNSTSERLHACWIGGRCCDLNYSGGQIARYLCFGNVGTNRTFYHDRHLDLTLQGKPDGIRWVARLIFYSWFIYTIYDCPC